MPEAHTCNTIAYDVTVAETTRTLSTGAALDSCPGYWICQATLEAPDRLIENNAENIFAALDSTGGKVTPEELARVVFQENRNDFNTVRGDDSSVLPIGGPEVKNLATEALFLFGRPGSLGIVEMRTDTAAEALGFGADQACI